MKKKKKKTAFVLDPEIDDNKTDEIENVEEVRTES